MGSLACTNAPCCLFVVELSVELTISPQFVMHTLDRAISRPTIFPLPGIVASLIFGQMGEEMLLGGQKVLPCKLTDAGFKFENSDIFGALERLLNVDE